MSMQKSKSDQTPEELRNEDPITGAAGAHPVGAGVGATLGGAAAGAAVGTVAGPIGTAAGIVVGGIAGGLAGKAVAENYDPTIETDYWRDNHHTRPYYNKKYSFEHYQPAYQAGWESFDPDSNENWQDREALARQRWENEGGAGHMSWEEAKHASEDAYTRVHSSRKNR